MLTYTGISITPDSIQSPSPTDLAVQMYRICRYAGAIRCSLLLHSYLVAGLIEPYADDNTLAWALLHDANECVLGDIPHPWKTPERKAVERVLDEAIAGRFRVDLAAVDQVLVKQADRSAFWFETDCLGPLPNREKYIQKWVKDGFTPMRPDVGARMVHYLSSALQVPDQSVRLAETIFTEVEVRDIASARRRLNDLIDLPRFDGRKARIA